MSEVTNLILSFSIGEDEAARIQDINSFEYRGLKLNLISADFDKNYETRRAWYGGTKFLETPLYIGALNHFDLNDFIVHLKSIHWEEPENVQVIVKEQHSDKFRIVEL